MAELKDNPTKASKMNTHWKNVIGIDFRWKQYKEMMNEQDFKCAICSVHLSDVKKSFAVDHDHATGKVRGLLCDLCNRALGQFKDNIDNLKAAINYLEKHK